MARMARVKSPTSMYHVMVKSISEFDLFRDDEDKIKYLTLIRKYQYKYMFGVYAYCLMDNHAHFMIDSLGADISKIMQVINFCYAQYYNKKYKRGGPVFRDRFKSKVVYDNRYLVNLSAYIHNNPKDIKGYSDNVASYPFSSLKEYINETDTFKILTPRFLRNIIGLYEVQTKKKYLDLVRDSYCEENAEDMEFVNAETEYRSERNIIVRDTKPEKIIAYVAGYLKQNKRSIHIKHNPVHTKFRAISCFLMSCFCNITQKEICGIMGNITQSRVSKLSSMGMEIALNEKRLLKEYFSS